MVEGAGVRVLIGRGDEREQFPQRKMKSEQVFEAELTPAPDCQNALNVFRAQPGHAQKQMARGLVQIDREYLKMAQSPGELRIDCQVEIGSVGGR